MLLGASIVAASGLFILHRKRALGRRRTSIRTPRPETAGRAPSNEPFRVGPHPLWAGGFPQPALKTFQGSATHPAPNFQALKVDLPEALIEAFVLKFIHQMGIVWCEAGANFADDGACRSARRSVQQFPKIRVQRFGIAIRREP
jgi:hypothetical protein